MKSCINKLNKTQWLRCSGAYIFKEYKTHPQNDTFIPEPIIVNYNGIYYICEYVMIFLLLLGDFLLVLALNVVFLVPNVLVDMSK